MRHEALQPQGGKRGRRVGACRAFRPTEQPLITLLELLELLRLLELLLANEPTTD